MLKHFYNLVIIFASSQQKQNVYPVYFSRSPVITYLHWLYRCGQNKGESGEKSLVVDGVRSDAFVFNNCDGQLSVVAVWKARLDMAKISVGELVHQQIIIYINKIIIIYYNVHNTLPSIL